MTKIDGYEETKENLNKILKHSPVVNVDACYDNNCIRLEVDIYEQEDSVYNLAHKLGATIEEYEFMDSTVEYTIDLPECKYEPIKDSARQLLVVYLMWLVLLLLWAFVYSDLFMVGVLICFMVGMHILSLGRYVKDLYRNYKDIKNNSGIFCVYNALEQSRKDGEEIERILQERAKSRTTSDA